MMDWKMAAISDASICSFELLGDFSSFFSRHSGTALTSSPICISF